MTYCYFQEEKKMLKQKDIFVRKANIFDLKLLNFIQTFEYHKHFQHPANIDISSPFTIYSVPEKNLHI